MKTINNFYEIKKDIYNWTPVKLVGFDDTINIFEILKNNQRIRVENGYFREISITKIHLERIGFENNSFNDVCVIPVYMMLGEDLLKLTSAYFGYMIFHKDELTNAQYKFYSVLAEVKEKNEINSNIIFDDQDSIKEKLNSIFNINELFTRLAEYNLLITEKTEILLG